MAMWWIALAVIVIGWAVLIGIVFRVYRRANGSR
jgi:hypothetical protein